MVEKGISSGAGGQGMVLLGELIAKAALEEGLEASVYPSYGPEMRGGAAHSSYVISDKTIANPVVADFDVALIMNKPSMTQFVCNYEEMLEREEMKKKGIRLDDRRLKLDGILIYNPSFIEAKDVPEAKGRKFYAVPVAELADDSKIFNMVLLGAYMQIKGRPKIETLEKIFHEEFTGKKERFLEPNLKALNAGMNYIKEHYKI